MKKIVILCSRLDLPGGIERAAVNCANLFQSKGNMVTLLIADTTAQLFYPVSEGVTILQLPLHFGITEKGNVLTRKLSLLKHIYLLRKTLNHIKPDVVIGTEYPLSIAGYLASLYTSAKVFAWEHHHFHWLEKNRFWDLLFRYVYPRLHYVVCNNATEKKLYKKIGSNAVVIPYVVPDQQAPTAILDEKIILTIGWLIKRKGVDLIPSIAREVMQKHPDWKWRIIGKGPELPDLEQQIKAFGLQSFIEIIPPETSDLTDVYLHASVFVMTSRFECLPMVLLEATRFGLPCVAFDCPTGPADIIEDGKNGYLVPLEDVKVMAARIDSLISKEENRKSMGTAAVESSRRYLPDAIYGQWRELF